MFEQVASIGAKICDVPASRPQTGLLEPVHAVLADLSAAAGHRRATGWPARERRPSLPTNAEALAGCDR
jgi:hypothetical protein